MAFIMSNPLVTICTPEQNKKDQELWESEDLGGITEDNNRTPVPVVWLLLLTVMTAFAITFPLWGQRPNAAIYADYVKDMDKPEIKALDDVAAMKQIVADNQGGPWAALRDRHPVTMDDLRALKPQIEALEKKGVDLQDYNIVGTDVVLANFEGNRRADGSLERHQPWWDKGYTIDIFYVIYFFTFVTFIVKQLPPSSWQPVHGHEH